MDNSIQLTSKNNGCTVVVIDDSKSFLNLFRIALDEHGHQGQLHLFQRCKKLYSHLDREVKALEKANNFWIVTDWSLDQPITKEENLDKICTYFSDTLKEKIVVLTDYLTKDVQEVCLNRGIVHIHQKPDDYSALVKFITEISNTKTSL